MSWTDGKKRRPHRAAPWSSACLLLALGSLAPGANAYWEATPDLRMNVIHETNPRYRRTSEDDATGAIADGRLFASFVTPTSRVTVTPRVRIARYWGSFTTFAGGEPQSASNSDLDYENYYLDANAAHRGLRTQWGLAASWRDTDVRTSEFFEATPIDPDSEIPPEPGSGVIVFPDDRLKFWSIQPSFAYNLTERNTLNAIVSLTDADYDQSNRANYLDYTFNSAQVYLSHALDQRSSVRLGITNTSFTARGENDPTFRNESDSWGISVGYDRTISQTWSGGITLGSSLSSVEVQGQTIPVPGSEPLLFPLRCFPLACNTDDQNFVGNLTLRRRAERTLVNFDIGRSIAPRSNGFTVIRNDARVFVERSLTSRLTASIALAYLDESSVADLTRFSRDYITVDLNGRWRLSRTWWLFGTYSYSSDETQRSGIDPVGVVEDVTNNRFLLGVQYRGIGWRR